MAWGSSCVLFLIHPCHAVGSMSHDLAGPVSGLNDYDWFVHCWFYFDSLGLDWIGCFKEAITRIRLTRFMIWYNSSNAIASDGDRTGSKHFIYPANPLRSSAAFCWLATRWFLFLSLTKIWVFFPWTAPVFQWFCLFYWALNLLLQIKMCFSVFLYYCSNRIATSTNKRIDEEYHRINPR